jgi:hypothetical protein
MSFVFNDIYTPLIPTVNLVWRIGIVEQTFFGRKGDYGEISLRVVLEVG